jgi:hypothetical protein
MLAPIFNFEHVATASYAGDARAFIWVLAWDNHAVLAHVPSLFDANKLYPLSNSLAYGEHLFAISLFTLPIYALTHNPVLGYNIVWLLAYVLSAAAVHMLAFRYTRDHLASLVAGMSFTFRFFRFSPASGVRRFPSRPVLRNDNEFQDRERRLTWHDSRESDIIDRPHPP